MEQCWKLKTSDDWYYHRSSKYMPHPGRHNLRININKVNLDEGADCMSSYLRIYDGLYFRAIKSITIYFLPNSGCKIFVLRAFKSLYYSKCFQEHHQEGDSLKNTVPVIIQQINLICSARLMNFTSDSRIQTKTSKTSLSRLFAVCIHVIFNFLFMINLKKLLALFLVVCPTK